MPAKYVVKKGSTGKFRFSLLGRNAQVIASSETYNTKAACMNGIKAVKAAAGEAEIEDQTTKQWAAEQQARKLAAKAATKKSPRKSSSAAAR